MENIAVVLLYQIELYLVVHYVLEHYLKEYVIGNTDLMRAIRVARKFGVCREAKTAE